MSAPGRRKGEAPKTLREERSTAASGQAKRGSARTPQDENRGPDAGGRKAARAGAAAAAAADVAVADPAADALATNEAVRAPRDVRRSLPSSSRRGLLLDTEVLLWALAAPERLSATARRLLGSEPVCVSVASLWETASLQAAGRLALPEPLLEAAERAGARWIALTPGHVQAAAALDAAVTDPLDRLLVATACHEGLRFVSLDSALLEAAAPALGTLALAA